MHTRRDPTLALSTAPDSLGEQIRETVQSWTHRLHQQTRAVVSSGVRTGGMRRLLRRTVTLANGLVVLWVWMLWWGERRVFEDSLEGCAWDQWETWVGFFFFSFLFQDECLGY